MKLKLYATYLIVAILASVQLQAQNTFPSSGKVGIGTTSPNASSLLEIKSTNKGLLIPRMTQAQRDAIGAPATGLLIYQTDNNPGFFYYSGSTWTGIQQKGKTWSLTGNQGTTPGTNFIGTTDAQDFVTKTNNAERMRITKAGNVGIGLTAPAAKLHVTGGSYFSLTSGGYEIIGDLNSYNLAFDPYNIQSRYNGSYASLDINNLGGSTYIGNSSNSYYGVVAYGTTYGLYGYAVSGYGVYGYSSSGGYGGYFSSGSGSGVYGYAGGGSGYYAGYFDNPNGIGVYAIDENGANHAVYAYSPGNGSTPGDAVYAYNASYGHGVSGYCNYGSGIYGSTGSGWAGYFNGNVYTTGTYQTSDETLKQNIKDVNNAMNIIEQLHPKTYNFRQDGDYKSMNLPQGAHYGLIAQDVEKVLPALVRETKFQTSDGTPISTDASMQKGAANKDSAAVMAKYSAPAKSATVDFKALNYTELIPIIIKAMQEMITNQQKENDDLQARLSRVEAALNLTSNNTAATSISSATLSSAALMQNAPNPYKNSTTISYNLPAKYSSAKIVITDNNGKMLKQLNVSGTGKGSVLLNAATLAAGTYNYSLIIDGNMVDSKQMVLQQ